MANERVQHRLAVRAQVGALGLDVALTFGPGWTVLFGPSGCGKTSLLRAMGGVLRCGAVGFERREDDGPWVALSGLAPEARRLGYAPQGGALFPHLTVRQNLEFPYVVSPSWLREATVVEEAMTLFRLHALAERVPSELSGGERQRVNLGRAFSTPRPKLMLLDEPFAGLDRGLRDELIPLLASWVSRCGVPVVSVTHDVDEALLLEAEVVRMEAGKVVAHGVGREVLAEERERLRSALG